MWIRMVMRIGMLISWGQNSGIRGPGPAADGDALDNAGRCCGGVLVPDGHLLHHIAVQFGTQQAHLVLGYGFGTLVEREVVRSTDIAADREEDQQEEIEDQDGGYAAMAILTAGQLATQAGQLLAEIEGAALLVYHNLAGRR